MKRCLAAAACGCLALGEPLRQDRACQALARDDVGSLSLLQRQRAPLAVSSQQAPRVRGSLNFVHIAKCAGSSFTRVLEMLVHEWNAEANHTLGMRKIKYKHRPLKLYLGDNETGLYARNPDCPDPLNITFVAEEVAGYNLNSFREACHLEEVTFLRDPIDRVMSLYTYYHEMRKQIVQPDEFSPENLQIRASMDTCEGGAPSLCFRGDVLLAFEKCWLWRGDCGVWVNHQVLVLAGERPEEEEFDVRLRIAKSYLDKMPFFGLTEYYRHSICLFVDIWFPDDAKHFDACCRGDEPSADCELVAAYNVEGNLNKFQVRDPHDDYQEQFLSNRTVAQTLFDSNVYDCKLYTYALRVFGERVQELEQRRGISLDTVRVPTSGTDYCDERRKQVLG
mmetsp:Transcript_91690/g.264453  ORF Transcript_91690/g.264453 Transcript_91690/m.264453 type:complete len:393 (-) Transcript_91690:15-1193(-)